MTHLLLADDDIALTDMLQQYLQTEGYEVSVAHNGKDCLKLAFSNQYDLIILDVMMPLMNGFDVLRELRKQSLLPVLMLTARTEDVDSIIGLELGADDYLPKPCNPRVLVARIEAILRRANEYKSTGQGSISSRPIKVNDVEINSASREVLLSGKDLPMTSTEYSVLELLLIKAGEVVAKDDLYLHALGRHQSQYDRSIDMHVSNLRKKLGLNHEGNERIKTVRGMGYQYIVGCDEHE